MAERRQFLIVLRLTVIQQFLCGIVDQRDLAAIVHGNDAFFDRLQHGLALLKQRGDFVGFQAEKDFFQYLNQNAGANQSDQHAK
ncbi:Uncharacterised protein [Shigella sonnei]|nr:Uncharacterised protein [Shigella sonnei]SRN41139.1 Uncharacterised protein [Shigella flexneri]CSE68885.1 Uncharacterised protein [Shigella sonnei]CSG16773.1 Uncharacterised protein [Shigella sonnei]CSG18225.1 Uncharacterised protein [Shigella sonnei]